MARVVGWGKGGGDNGKEGDAGQRVVETPAPVRQAAVLEGRAHPGTDLVWPGNTELIVWLMDRLEAPKKEEG